MALSENQNEIHWISTGTSYLLQFAAFIVLPVYFTIAVLKLFAWYQSSQDIYPVLICAVLLLVAVVLLFALVARIHRRVGFCKDKLVIRSLSKEVRIPLSRVARVEQYPWVPGFGVNFRFVNIQLSSATELGSSFHFLINYDPSCLGLDPIVAELKERVAQSQVQEQSAES